MANLFFVTEFTSSNKWPILYSMVLYEFGFC